MVTALLTVFFIAFISFWVFPEIVDMLKDFAEVFIEAFFDQIDRWKQIFKSFFGKDKKK